MMTDRIIATEEAKHLAAQNYAMVIITEQIGNEIGFLAYHPELPGCHSQGATSKGAQALLDGLRPEWIQCLLDDKLPVPPPIKERVIVHLGEVALNHNFSENACPICGRAKCMSISSIQAWKGDY